MARKLRSLMKSVTWRLIGFFVLLTVTWLSTGSWLETTSVTLAFNLIQVFTYYIHERFWERWNWGT